MNTEWKIGNKYQVEDIMTYYEGTLEGFIINQCPVNWKNKHTYSNRSDDTIYFVFSFQSDYYKAKHYVVSYPQLRNNYSEVNFERPLSSSIYFYGLDYGESVEQLLAKLKQNRVFTKELSYDAKYKEGFKQEL